MGIFGTNIKRLAKKGEVEKLIKALENSESKVRVEAAEALERLGASEAHQPIINAWSSDKLKTIPSVAWAIKETQTAKAVQKIIKTLTHWKNNLKLTRQRDPLSQWFFLEYVNQIIALGIIGDISSLDVLIDELKDYWNTLKERAGESAGPIEFVTNGTTDRNLDTSIPRLIEEALVKIGEPAVEPVSELLKNDNVAVRESAKSILEKLGASKKERGKISEKRIEDQKRIDIFYNNKKVGTYIPDKIINNSIILELKCKPFITKEDKRQFWYYLKASPYKLGLLINFGSKNLEIYRRIYDKAREKSLRKSA